MADQDYPELYARMKQSADEMSAASVSQKQMMTADENTDVTIPGYGPKPSYSKQILAKMLDIIASAPYSFAGRVYNSPGEGVDPTIGVGDGKFYNARVPGNDDVYIGEYQNVGGVATPVLDSEGRHIAYPSAAVVMEMLQMISRDPNSPDFVQFRNAAGYVAFLIKSNFTIKSGRYIEISNTEIKNKIVGLAADLINAQSFKIRYDIAQNAAMRINFARGYYANIVDGKGKVIGTSNGNTPAPTDDPYRIRARNAENMAKANQIAGRKVTNVMPLASQINGIIMFGQSLSTGYEGWPAISKTWYQRLNNLMLGNATRPNARASNTFVPVGTTQFTNLKAVVQSSSNPNIILTDSATAVLAPGASEEGESPLVGAVNFLKYLYLQDKGLYQDDNMQLVASDCGVAGRTIEQLRQNHWNRFTQCVDAQKAEADRLGKTYSVAVLYFMQGEWNYVTTYNGTTDKDEYKALMKSLKADMIAYVKSVTGQELDPAFIIYQTGASYTFNDDRIKIGMAQLEFANEEPGVWCAGPTYQLTDKSGHLQPNGYRAYGMYLGYTAYLATVARLDSRATQPLKYTVYDKRVIIGDILAMDFPLRFEVAYDVVTPVDYAAKGFKVVDSIGAVTVASVELVADTVVKITTTRDLVGSVDVVYAGKLTFNGNGNLTGSSPLVPLESYVYQDGTGQYASTNIPALVNKPYSMHNWCLAHRLTAEVVS